MGNRHQQCVTRVKAPSSIVFYVSPHAGSTLMQNTSGYATVFSIVDVHQRSWKVFKIVSHLLPGIGHPSYHYFCAARVPCHRQMSQHGRCVLHVRVVKYDAKKWLLWTMPFSKQKMNQHYKYSFKRKTLLSSSLLVCLHVLDQPFHPSHVMQLMFLLPNERDNAGWGVELGVLEDRALLELQSGSEHRTTGSQDEQHEQEDGEREEEWMDVDFPESWSTREREQERKWFFHMMLNTR